MAPASAARIACVGDSYTYGWGVELDESYPKQLEKCLSSHAPREVLNFGVFGYNARQVEETLRQSREQLRQRAEELGTIMGCAPVALPELASRTRERANLER